MPRKVVSKVREPAVIASRHTPTKWNRMTNAQILQEFDRIVDESTSQAEVNMKLHRELGYPDYAVVVYMPDGCVIGAIKGRKDKVLESPMRKWLGAPKKKIVNGGVKPKSKAKA